ncbi:MAG: sigma-70 family RNA polymerase sigma factor [Oscillospiraceae bacterium]|jgi:RNA polymerase sigma-70 factor (ECF subfamily)|nr:sigma-70 family RNA polymerase sigma factor [Oscillospiraceae bacterium]
MITQIRLNRETPGVISEEYSVPYIVEEYGDMMYKLASSQLNNRSDAFDAVQDVLLAVHTKKPVWNGSEHVKSWLIRAVINKCRDYNKSLWNKNGVDLSEAYGVSTDADDYRLQETLANLPRKYRLPLYLHYYEGYKIREIAKILKVGESGVKKRLVKGREMLKNLL